jgi:predicted permease
MSNISLIGDGHSGSAFHVTGRPMPSEEDRVQTNSVGTDFFQTMAIPIVQGRGFNSHDNARSPKVAIVNRALARRFFPDESPIGQTFECEDVNGPVQIVGLAADTRYTDLRGQTPPTFYMPYRQGNLPGRMTVEIRTAAEPLSVLASVRSAVESLDRDLPLIDVRAQEQQIQSSLSRERTFARLTGGFGMVALALATAGIYGLMAYTVAGRTSEIGIRMALGARMGQILAGVLREALWLSCGGVMVGVGVSLWLAQFIGSMLYGLTAADPATLAFTAGLLIAVALLAGLGPARRASRVHPLSALRHQ